MRKICIGTVCALVVVLGVFIIRHRYFRQKTQAEDRYFRHFEYLKQKMEARDKNNDGKMDTWTYKRGGRVHQIYWDQDGDGCPDKWREFFEDGRVKFTGWYVDLDGDGRTDGLTTIGGPPGGASRLVLPEGRVIVNR